jgi:hypothetical protein
MTIIAVASGIERLDHSPDLLAFEHYSLYPGSIWYHALACEAAGCDMPTVGVGAAIAQVERGQVRGSDVLLVQERESALGDKLLQRGGRGAVLTSLESPLYAARFYAMLPALSSRFHASFLFPPFMARSRATHSDAAFFPRELPPDPTALIGGPRQGHCVVATYRRPPWRSGSIRTLSRLGYQAVRSATVRDSIALHLLSTRVAVVRRLAMLGTVDLYGRGWPTAQELSPQRQASIHLQGPVDNKQKALQRHRFNVCLENTAIAGYVTEKFADAVEAGCVPIYSAHNLVGAVGRFEVPFVNTADLLKATNPQRLLDQGADRFDRWAADPQAVAAFLSQFDHRLFARQILDRVRTCAQGPARLQPAAEPRRNR